MFINLQVDIRLVSSNDMLVSLNHSTINIIDRLQRPFGLCLGKTPSHLWICDYKAACVLKFDLSTKQTTVFKHPDMIGPHAVTLHPHGNSIIVTDYLGKQMLEWTTEGDFKGRWNQSNSESSLLHGPATALFKRDKTLLVSDYGSHSIVKFDSHGVFIGKLSLHGHQLDRVHACAELPDGDLLVVDTWNHLVLKVDQYGNPKSQLSSLKSGFLPFKSLQTVGSPQDQLQLPVSIDIQEDLFVISEVGSHRLSIFDLNGVLQWSYSEGLFKPYDVKFFGKNCLVADTDHGRVVKIAWA